MQAHRAHSPSSNEDALAAVLEERVSALEVRVTSLLHSAAFSASMHAAMMPPPPLPLQLAQQAAAAAERGRQHDARWLEFAATLSVGLAVGILLRPLLSRH
jgi:predicted metal-binding membrane protein